MRRVSGRVEYPARRSNQVLTNHNEDRRYHPDNAGNRLCADVAKAVFDHFQAGPSPVQEDEQKDSQEK